MELFGLAQQKGWPAGRVALSHNTRSLPDSTFFGSLRIERARYGPREERYLMAGSVRFEIATFSVTERTVVLALPYSIYMRTTKALSGQEHRQGFGDGNLVLRNFIR